jgi:hypothetical protein
MSHSIDSLHDEEVSDLEEPLEEAVADADTSEDVADSSFASMDELADVTQIYLNDIGHNALLLLLLLAGVVAVRGGFGAWPDDAPDNAAVAVDKARLVDESDVGNDDAFAAWRVFLQAPVHVTAPDLPIDHIPPPLRAQRLQQFARAFSDPLDHLLFVITVEMPFLEAKHRFQAGAQRVGKRLARIPVAPAQNSGNGVFPGERRAGNSDQHDSLI